MKKKVFPRVFLLLAILLFVNFIQISFANDNFYTLTQKINSKEKKSITILSEKPDIILYNANVITMDSLMPDAQAIAIKLNLVFAVGSNTDILSLQDANTQLIDLQGLTVVPGLIEAHSHYLLNAFWDDGPEGLARATREMAADGYTTVHELYGDPGFIACAQTLAQNKELSVRINCYIPYNTNCNDNVVQWKIFTYTEKADTTLRVIGVKIFADGGSCGRPALSTLYQAGPAEGTHGNLFRTQDEMNAIVDTILKAGYPIAMHAIGDSAISVGLNAFEYAFAGNGNMLRSRMEHLNVMREDLANQMAYLGIAASIQYTWANALTTPRLESYYLPEVLEWCYPWRRLADRNIPIIGGNDFPYCSRSQAMQTISILATRRTQLQDTVPAWLEGDQLTVEEGLRAMTVTNAWVAFEEDFKGTISAGKLADLSILSDDPLTTDPFDVRNISIEMTIMDGIIRYDQIGINHIAVHDAGLFKMGIDDKGLWGLYRTNVGLHYNELENLYQGSLVISYDNNIVATANTRQQDYIPSSNESISFIEPGIMATEEGTAIYEDGAEGHQDKLQITQQTFMWEGDPLLLVKYTLKNISENPLSDIYVGQVMDFDIGHYADNMGKWEANNGLGFAYIYNAMSTDKPYIGMAMFDTSGNYVNTELSFTSPSYFNRYQEQLMAEIMRSGIIESETPETGDYSILLSYGPVSFDIDQSVSPFVIAIVVGNDLSELKNAVNLAYSRLNNITGIFNNQQETPDKLILFQNFPNPFSNGTTISYHLPKAAIVNISIYNTSGQLVKRLVNESQTIGYHTVHWNTDLIRPGLYYYQIKAGDFVEVKKCVLLK